MVRREKLTIILVDGWVQYLEILFFLYLSSEGLNLHLSFAEQIQ